MNNSMTLLIDDNDINGVKEVIKLWRKDKWKEYNIHLFSAWYDSRQEILNILLTWHILNGIKIDELYENETEEIKTKLKINNINKLF